MKKHFLLSGLLGIVAIVYSQSVYNYKGSGALNALTSWTLNPGGTNPPNFTDPNQIFVLTNATSTTLSATGWTVSGSGSEIRIGDGSSATKLAVNSNATLMVSGGAKLRVQNNGTLDLYQTNLSYLPSSTDVILHNGSTVNWMQNSNVSIWPLNYWNMGLYTTTKNLAASTSATIQNQYITNNLTINLNNGSGLFILGNVTGIVGLRSSSSTSSIVIGGSGTSSVNISLPVNDQTFGYFELSRNSLVKWNKNGGLWVRWYSLSASTGTIDITGLSNGHVLYIHGNTTLGCTWRAKNTLNMSFTGSGTISGNLNFETGYNSLSQLTLNKSQTLILGTPLDIYTSVNINAGTLASGGNLTLKSSATQKARINTIAATADVTGNVNVEVFAKGGYTGWTNLAAAGVSGQTMAAGWGDDFPMTCPSGCPNGSTAGGAPFTSVTTYNETNNTYPAISSGSDPITPGVGYWVYLGNGQTTTTDILIDMTGPIVKKAAGSWNFTKTTGQGEGWNLIGNPYPSPISFAKAFGTHYSNGKMANELRVWNPDLNGGNGDYALYKVGVGSTPPVASGGVDDNIPMGQAFYIVAITNFSIVWDESFKTTSPSNNPLLKTMNTVPEPNRLFYLNLTGSGGANTYCGIHFNNNATITYHPDYDAENIEPYPGAPQIFIENSNKNLKVKGIPYPNGSVSLDVQVESSTTGTYQIALQGTENIPAGACITLIDHLTSTNHNLLQSPYTFTHSSNTPIPRFSLNITLNNLTNTLTTGTVNIPQCYQNNNGILAADMGSGNYTFVWKDINNQILRTVSGVSRDTLKNISEGWYFVEVSDGNCSNITQPIQLVATIGAPVADFITNADTLPTNTAFIFTNTSQNLSYFYWDFGDGNTSTATNPTHSYANPGNYLVLMQGVNACGDTVSTWKELIVTAVTGLNPDGVPVSPALFVSRDQNGYYLSADYTKDTRVNVWITDILGRTLMQETVLLSNNKKVYLPNLLSQQIIVIKAEDGYNIINKKIFIE